MLRGWPTTFLSTGRTVVGNAPCSFERPTFPVVHIEVSLPSKPERRHCNCSAMVLLKTNSLPHIPPPHFSRHDDNRRTPVLKYWDR